MPLESGSKLGVYEVIAPLGAGGMGEVYRARDTKLNRDVAIKVLPDTFVSDRDRVGRFTREAQMLAALNHPHIAAIYGLEETGGTQFLVMELIDGESLAQRLALGRLSLGDALPIARQIIDALEAAHERGIVHRDLKPANIMLTADGGVKVLDFGLAKFDERGSSPDLTNSPTLSFAATQAGVILGTAAYMSPEQAKGRVADRRSDVWAFGCVLYEMLAGTRAFDGEDLSDTLATVLKSDPDWNALPASVPSYIRAILKSCLEKDRRSRIPDISVVRYLLGSGDGQASRGDAEEGTRRRTAVAWKMSAAAFALIAAAGIPAMYILRSSTPAVARFTVLPPEKRSFETGNRAATSVAIAPDGRRLAFVARDTAIRSQIWIRPLDSLSAQPLAGTDGAAHPFWSPDSRFVGFFAGNKLLKVDVTGGPPQTLCVCSGRGGTWNRDGVIVFNNGPGPLYRVPSTGGQPTAVTRASPGVLSHVFPSFLPDGRHILFFGVGASDATSGVYIASLEDGNPRQLVAANSGGVFSPQGGYLLFSREGTLLAQSFDLRTLKLAGEPFPVAERVESTAYPGVVSFSVSDSGVLAYGTGAGAQSALRLTWVDREGKVAGTAGPDANYRGVDLSPDGKRVAAHRHDGSGGDIWLTDLTRGTTSRFTFDASQDNSSPIWSPNGGDIVFGSLRSGKWSLFRKLSNGAGSETKLAESDLMILPMSWAPDGQSIVYWTNDPRTGGDQWKLPLGSDPKPAALLNSPFSEGHSQISPDGRWFSYQSNETGRAEVYVRPYPAGPGQWQVSTEGGIFSRWRGDGRELFYMSAVSNGKMMAVDIKSSATTLEASTPKPLFDTGYVNLPSGGNYHTFAVSRDGQRFLIPRPVSNTSDDSSSPIVVVTNWTAGIR